MKKQFKKRQVPCSHDHFEKEYILGSDTGDYVCTGCGKIFSRFQKENLEKSNYKF